MKKFLFALLSTAVLCAGIIFFLNIEVTSRQGINYQWHTVKIPLYLKILDFYDRHFNYKALVKRIVKDIKGDSERVLKIFEWTHQNIRKAPDDFPIIDDHVWHIIIRGYGTDEQACDVFSTLCNYIGVDAFFNFVYTKERTHAIPLSFVKLDKKWRVFDPYNGVYFKNYYGDFASIEQIRNGEWILNNSSKQRLDIDYTRYLKELSYIKNVGLTRANIQSPFNRLFFELKKWFKQ